MHFRPFSVKKYIRFSSDFAAFSDYFHPIFFFFTIFLRLGLPLPLKPSIPHGSQIVVFYKKNKEKIGFPMPTPKNGFQILNLHPKIHIFKEKNTLFLMYFCLSITVLSAIDIYIRKDEIHKTYQSDQQKY